MARYWLVKVSGSEDDIGMTGACLRRMASDDSLIELVEIIPEKRDSNWMERALVSAALRDEGGEGV